MNYIKGALISGLLLLIVLSSLPVQNSAQNLMNDTFGTNFSNEFGLVIDFNYNNGPSNTSVGAHLQVLKDLGNSSNPKINPIDTDLTNSQQFFFSHFNVDSVDNMYLALNKLEFNISFGILGKTINFGHVNGSAPFQSLLQFFKSYGNDVLVTNTFRGLVAYSTQTDNGTISPSTHTYLGYSFVEPHLLNVLNGQLISQSFSALPQYNYEPLYFPQNQTFGMKYDNYFVVWQDTAPTAPSALTSIAGHQFDNVVSGSNMVAASLFKYLKFTYHIVEDQVASNSTYKVVNVVVNYDLGPMEWLITRDSATQYATIASSNTQINKSNSFNTAATSWSTIVPTPSPIPNIQVTENIPELTYYTGAAVSQRLNAQTMKNSGVDGMGIAIASSTNTLVFGQTLGNTLPITNGQNTTIPLSYGISTFYNTNFDGKSTYSRTFTNGTTESNLPAYISLRSLSDMSQLMDISSMLQGYFQLQTAQTTGISVYSAQQLDPTQFSTSSSSNLKLDVSQTQYVTLVQIPKWSGLQVTQDPVFSAISTIGDAPVTTPATNTTTSSSTTTSTSSVSIINTNQNTPGFQFIILMATISLILVFRKKKLF